MKTVSGLLFSLVILFHSVTAYAQDLEGDPEARAQTEALIEAVGGRDVWGASKSFTVRERIYLGSGETAEAEIVRNLADVTRWIRLEAETFSYEEVLERDYGWRGRDGDAQNINEDEFRDERTGLEQSLYFVYHRLAKGDPRLRVEWIEDERRLNVYEDDERLLCWFFFNGRSEPISWANIYDGREVRHNYGPLIDVGDANFPKWGAAADASWRFEYLEARFSSQPAKMPGPR